MIQALSSPESDAIVALVRQKVQLRKALPQVETFYDVDLPIPRKTKRNPLQRAELARVRAKAKNDAVRSWPKFLRSTRLNQHAVNEAVLEALENMASESERQQEMLQTTQSMYADLAAKHAALLEKHSELSQEQKKHVQEARTKFAHLENVAHMIESWLQASTEIPQSQQLPRSESDSSLAAALMDIRIDSFYLAFEDQFRGSRALIKERLLAYAPHLSAVKQQMTDAAAVDVGCGRGEWLEVLKEHGIAAHGVDMNERMAAQCRSFGLDASRGDGIAHLQNLPAESQAVVSGFHIVEHLPFPQLFELIRQSFRVLRPGGLAIFETPNPECLHVSTRSFYYDPTHRNPIPSELLAFLAAHVGFSETQIERLQPYTEEGVFKGYLDYGGIFRK